MDYNNSHGDCGCRSYYFTFLVSIAYKYYTKKYNIIYIMVEVMGIEPMSQRVYHPVYFYSLI